MWVDSLGLLGVDNFLLTTETYTPYEMKIYWYGTVSCDLDYLIIEDQTSYNEFNGVYDYRLSQVVNEFGDHPGLANIKVCDEATVNQLLFVRYKKQKIDTYLSGTGNEMKVALSFHPPNWSPLKVSSPQQFLAQTQMDVLFSDIYPIYLNLEIPGDPNYLNAVQGVFNTGLNNFLEGEINIADRFEKPFWFVPQVHEWDRPGAEWLREPSAYEIRAMANLGVCYGAKGMYYFMYSQPNDGTIIAGVTLLDDDDINTPIPRYKDYYQFDKWKTVKDLNQKLTAIGNELITLTWQNSVYIHDGTQPANSYITNIESVQDIPANTYIQLGLFKSTDNLNDQNLEHYFIVNRRTDENDDRDIEVQYDKSGSNPNNFYNWTVKEVGTTNYWSSASPTNQFTTTYEPGDGKLFKLQPTVIGGGDLLHNETISSDIELHGDLIIKNGNVLTVNANYHCYGNIILQGNYSKIKTTNGNGKIYFHDGAGIIVVDKALILSEHTNKLEIDFIDPAFNSGIETEVGSYLQLENCIIKNSGAGVHSTNHIILVIVSDVDFINCTNYAVSINGPATYINYVGDCTFQDCYGGIFVNNVGEVQILRNHITNSDIGINLLNVTSPYVISNIITSTKNTMPGIFLSSSDGEVRSNLINGHSTGIYLANSSPDLGDNFIDHNFYHGVYVGAGSLPDMHAELMTDDPEYYAISGYNTIWENGGYTTGGIPDNDGSEIYFGSSTSNANMNKGCNAIFDNRSPQGDRPPYNTRLLMNGYSFGIPITVNAEYNYWSVNPLYPLSTRFGSLNVYYNPILSDPCDYSSEGQPLLIKTSEGDIVDTVYSIDRTVGTLSITDILYSKAEEKYFSADYSGAEQIYNQVIASNDTLFAKQLAYQRLYEIGKITSKPASYFNDLYSDLSSASQSTEDSVLQKKFSQLASLSLVGQEEFAPAIGEFDNVVQQKPGTEEAVYAEIDALTTALLIEPGDSTLGKTAAGKYIMSPNEYGKRINQLLQKNFGAKNETKEEETIPTDYVLYQNYPNPFNPVTTIKFDIPNPGQTELIIYDILGNKIKTLVNDVKQPGRYEISWDASGVSSGVYIYQLRVNEFITSKKMILLK